MAILNLHVADECCSPELAIALSNEIADLHALNTWTCSKCGTEWRSHFERLDMGEAIKYWKPECPILIF